mgnify:FL=1
MSRANTDKLEERDVHTYCPQCKDVIRPVAVDIKIGELSEADPASGAYCMQSPRVCADGLHVESNE